MTKRIIGILALALLTCSVRATHFYVDTAGSDSNNGLSIDSAWASIDRGDQLGEIYPGDTINILPGRYAVDRSMTLTASGESPDSLIVYRRYGVDSVQVISTFSGVTPIRVQGDYTVVRGVDVIGGLSDGIEVSGRHCLITECLIKSVNDNGLYVANDSNVILRNIVVHCGQTAIRVEGDYCRVYNNTVYENEEYGIELTATVDSNRIYNNIVTKSGSHGITGSDENICGYNLVWDNEGNDYNGSILVLEGGLWQEPGFVNPNDYRFDLKHTADEIDAGKDLGYPYTGEAPDIGAKEKFNAYYVSLSGSDDNDGRSELTAFATITNADLVVLPGDTVFVLPGTYPDSVDLAMDGIEDDVISYVGVRDSCTVDATGADLGVHLKGAHTSWVSIDVANAAYANFFLVGDSCSISYCKIASSASRGIDIRSDGHTFVGNVISNNDLTGIINIIGVSHSYKNNTFYHNGDVDIITYTTPVDFFANNIFIAASATSRAVVTQSSAGEVLYSIFYGYDDPLGGLTQMGEGSFYSNPQLIDPENGNFRLLSESPAIDMGVYVGLPYNGAAPDIGARETAPPAQIIIDNPYDTLRADSTYSFSVDAFDSEGFPTRPGSVVWDHTFTSGSINSQGLFTPGLIGSGTITAASPLYGLTDETDPLTVVPGPLYDIDITPTRDTVLVDSTLQFALQGSDVRGNPIDDLGTITWGVLNGIGSINATGLFTAQHPGFGFIRAVSNLGPLVISDTITVTPENAFLSITSVSIPPKTLIPGRTTGPLLVLDLTNNDITDFHIDSIRIRFSGIDPDGAGQADLDSQFELVSLYLEQDNLPTTLGGDDELLTSGVLEDGAIVFPTEGIVVPAEQGNLRLSVAGTLSLETAKNGNTVAFELGESVDIFSQQTVPVEGDFPIMNDVTFEINAFPLSAVTVNDLNSDILYQGQTNNVVLDFELPSNGYAEDELSQIVLIDSGSFAANDQNLDVKLWADVQGDGDIGNATLLGNFEYSSYYWSLGNLHQPLLFGGNRFLVTIDIVGDQFEGGTFKLKVPAGGIDYDSGTDGPDDGAISNQSSFLIMPSDRVTAISIPTPTRTIAPGSSGNTILTFALYNGYASAKSLQSVRFTNSSHSASSLDYADAELGQITLHYDDNINRVLDGDPVVASGHFDDGTLTLSMRDLALPSHSLSYFFVASDMPELGAIDSDSLTVTIEKESDIVFEYSGIETVNINGDLPLTSGGYLVIDGSVLAQYKILSIPSSTVSPGDTSVVLMAFRPALNGDQADQLTSLTVSNTGTAAFDDFELLELWFDQNGDNLWQSSDLLLSTLPWTGSAWTSGAFELEISETAPTLFVTGDVSAMATPDVTFSAQIPIEGCEYLSANDGPLDAALVSPADFTISGSGLRVSTQSLNSSYSVGQEIELSALVTNVHAGALDSVFCQFSPSDDPSDSTLVGPVPLAADENHEYNTTVVASTPGEASWKIMSFSKNPVDSSASITTDVVEIQQVPTDVMVELTNSMPTAVSRGQTNVFPLSVSFRHADGASQQASLRLDSLRLAVEDEAGQLQAANSVFSRMVIANEYANLAIVTTVPSETSVLLQFSQPVIVPPGEEQLLSLLVDIDDNATASDFVLAIAGGPSINIVDQNTLATVSLDPGLIFPMKTASCRIDDASQQLAVSGTSALNSTVNYGQDDVDALTVTLRHPGSDGSSQVQLTKLAVEFIDENSLPLEAASLITSIGVVRQQTLIGELATIPEETSKLAITFNAPPTLSSGETMDLNIRLSMRELSSQDAFAVRIADSTDLTVRDLSSGSLITAISDPVLATGCVFPIASGTAELRFPATPLDICISPANPASVVGGAEAVELLGCTFTSTAPDNYSAVIAREMQVGLFDSTGAPINANELFDRIGFSINDEPMVYEPFIELVGGRMVFHLDDDGITIAPGETVNLTLLGDIENATPISNFVMTIANATDLTVRDATDTASNPGVNVASDCSTNFPMTTTATVVFLPAGRPALSTSTHPVQICFPGQTGLPLLGLDVSYDSPTLQGDVVFSGLRAEALQRTTSGSVPIQAANLFKAVYLTLDGDTVACDSVLTDDSIVLTLDSAATFSREETHELAVLCDIALNAQPGNHFLSLPDSSCFDIADKNLLTEIFAVLVGESYPLLSTEISLTAAGLANSFTTFPNPFNPNNGEVATIGYVLTDGANVSIEMYTITGELVKRIVDGSYRDAGSHREDCWDGLNEVGMSVIPGTYFCRIYAEYLSGGTETFKRKVTVIR